MSIYIIKWIVRNSNGLVPVLQEIFIQENISKIAGDPYISFRKEEVEESGIVNEGVYKSLVSLGNEFPYYHKCFKTMESLL